MAGFWQDQAFEHDPSLVTTSAEALFALDPALVRSIRASPEALGGNRATRSALLLSLIFGPEMKAFAYAGGHSTVAAETWNRKRGDCLSLSVMTVAIGRVLELPVQIQEVRVPVSFDRRGGIDFLNTHVNVLVQNDRMVRAAKLMLPASDIVIDFEPQVGSRQRGTPLGDQAVLSRYLNNLGAEHLADGRERLAYAHFKAAILAQPDYAASCNNLAQLYLRAGLQRDAEALLRHALNLDGSSDLALSSLHKLLQSQGRNEEASRYARLIEAHRERDPYYWLGLGLEHLQLAQYQLAVAALERAQALTHGFEEVHRYLAIAYWRTGQLHRARDQLAVLGAVGSNDAKLAMLQRKFQLAP